MGGRRAGAAGVHSQPEGRPPLTHRQAPTGTLFVLKTGLPWEHPPAELGCGSGMSCRRRLAAWPADGTWTRRHAALLERLHAAGTLDWRRTAIGSPSVRAAFGGPRPGPTRRAGARAARSTT